MIYRIEKNVETGEIVQIEQVIYQSEGGDIIVLDVGQEAPEGYSQITEVPEQSAPVPAFVTMRQARLALHAAGLLTQVQAVIDAQEDPPKTAMQIEWDYSSDVYRDKEFVVTLGAALGLTSDELDELFIAAAAL